MTSCHSDERRLTGLIALTRYLDVRRGEREGRYSLRSEDKPFLPRCASVALDHPLDGQRVALRRVGVNALLMNFAQRTVQLVARVQTGSRGAAGC